MKMKEYFEKDGELTIYFEDGSKSVFQTARKLPPTITVEEVEKIDDQDIGQYVMGYNKMNKLYNLLDDYVVAFKNQLKPIPNTAGIQFDHDMRNRIIALIEDYNKIK